MFSWECYLLDPVSVFTDLRPRCILRSEGDTAFLQCFPLNMIICFIVGSCAVCTIFAKLGIWFKSLSGWSKNNMLSCFYYLIIFVISKGQSGIFKFSRNYHVFLGHSVHSFKGFMRQPFILKLVLVANVEHPWTEWIAVIWDKKKLNEKECKRNFSSYLIKQKFYVYRCELTSLHGGFLKITLTVPF